MATNRTNAKNKNTESKKGVAKTTTKKSETKATPKKSTKKTTAKKVASPSVKKEKIEIEKKVSQEETTKLVSEIHVEKKEELKKEKQPDLLNQNLTIRIILAGIIILASIVGMIYSIVKKEQKSEEPSNKIVMLDEEKGKIILENIKPNDTKTIYFHVKNDSNEEKVYNVETKNIKNELTDPTKLRYDLFINDKLEISNEIFPSEDMLLIEGALVYANDDLEFKVVLNYLGENESEDLGKNVSGSLIVVEDKD
ncbi:MAG: hypothetical protein HFH86_02505 [Bacilli bacterium]|nr:hypothetical protein [Bacilli bacterium]